MTLKIAGENIVRPKVFLSYSMKDRQLVYSALRRFSEGFQTADFEDPADWAQTVADARKAIGDKIRAADTFLLIWSSDAAKSPWVQYELGMAHALDVPIEILVAEGSQADLPPGLASSAARI